MSWPPCDGSVRVIRALQHCGIVGNMLNSLLAGYLKGIKQSVEQLFFKKHPVLAAGVHPMQIVLDLCTKYF